MTTIVIIAVVLAALYGFAAITFYYGFRNWHPMCGGRTCGNKEQGVCDRTTTGR